MLFRSDRKSTRLNSSHTIISYAVFCLKKKNKHHSDPFPASLLYPAPRVTHFIAATRRSWRPGYVHRATKQRRSLPALFFFFLMIGGPPRSTLFPYTPPFR